MLKIISSPPSDSAVVKKKPAARGGCLGGGSQNAGGSDRLWGLLCVHETGVYRLHLGRHVLHFLWFVRFHVGKEFLLSVSL